MIKSRKYLFAKKAFKKGRYKFAKRLIAEDNESEDNKESDSGKLTVEEAMEKINSDKYEVQDVIDQVPENKQSEVFKKLREQE